ncbi:Cell morphogenesis protein PAG1 [Coemansia sp. RSA 1722]|nr:Cell morphogenesis protein PAG1 [Coemansia sp. RSA 1722]
MSSEQLSSTIDPTLLQSLAQQHINTSAQLSGFSQLQINSDSPFKNSHSYGDNIGTPFINSTPMNDSNSTTAPINISRAQGLGAGNQQQQLAGSATSFNTEYERGGIANSFQQHIQRQQFQQQQQQQQNQNLFRSHLASPNEGAIFSPIQDDVDVSPVGSMPNNSIAAMTSGALPTSIPVSYQGGQRVGANQMFRMQTFSNSPPGLGQAFQSMSLPAHTDWFDGHLVQQQSIGSALDASSFAAQQHLASSNADGMSPPNQTLMSLMENDDGVVGQKSEVLNYEKRRRRRESHNAVERRRRDNINDRIQELYTLLPEAMIDANTKPNKGIILKKSVEYIRHLQQALQSQGVRIHELETGMSGQSVQQHNQATSGLAAMLAGAASMNQGRSSNDGSMMNTGL